MLEKLTYITRGRTTILKTAVLMYVVERLCFNLIYLIC